MPKFAFTLAELESRSLCRPVGMPAGAKGLSAGSKALLLALRRAGEAGLGKTHIKPFLALDPLCADILEIRMLAGWLPDGRGRPARLVLTWKGDETAEALHRVLVNRQSSSWLTGKAGENREGGKAAVTK